MSEAVVMWSVWSALMVVDLFVVAYFVRTVVRGRRRATRR